MNDLPARLDLLVITVHLFLVARQSQNRYKGMADDRHGLLYQHRVGHPHVDPGLGSPVIIETHFLWGRDTA